MTEMERGFDPAKRSERQIADRIVAIVEWLAWVEKEDEREGSAARLGYYEVDQAGPIQYGDLYFGKIIAYDGDEIIHHHQIYLTPPSIAIDKSGFWDSTPMDINVSFDGAVTVNDNDYKRMPTYVDKTVDHFLGWLAAANLRHSTKTDQL